MEEYQFRRERALKRSFSLPRENIRDQRGDISRPFG